MGSGGISGTVFRDVILLALLGFVSLTVMMLPHVNPKGRSEETIRIPGNIVIEARWADHKDTYRFPFV